MTEKRDVEWNQDGEPELKRMTLNENLKVDKTDDEVRRIY